MSQIGQYHYILTIQITDAYTNMRCVCVDYVILYLKYTAMRSLVGVFVETCSYH